MSRRLIVVAVVLAAGWITLHGQSLPGAPTRAPVSQPTPPAAQNQPGVIVGQVVDSASGRGVARAAVHLAGRGIDQLRVADDRGRFYFVDIPEGDVEIVASKPGFFDGGFGKRRAGGRGIPLTMIPGRWITDLRIDLYKGAAISGVVTDEGGEPVIGIRVRAWRRDYAEGREQLVSSGEVITHDDGTYRLYGLQPGSYIISVPSVQVTLPVDSLNTTTGVPIELWALLNLNHATSPEDRLVHPDGKYVLAVGTNATPPPVSKDGTLAYRTEFYPGFESPLMAIPIELSPSEDRAGVHFQLRLVPAHRVSGVVTGPTGPLSNQLVRLVVDGEEDNGFGSEAATTMTGPDGTFALLNVPAGRYSLQVRTLAGILGAASPPVPSTEATLRTSSVKSWGEVAVMVTDSDISDVHVDVLPSVALSGRVVLEGRPRVTAVDVTALRVGVLPADRTIGAALTQPLDKDGRFKFDGLAPGSYFVRVSAIPRGFALKSISGGGVDLLDRPAEIDDDTDVTIVFDDSPNELWGTVRDPRGAQAVGASIIMFPADAGAAGLNSNRARETRAATSGLYSIAGLPAGDYYVVAIDDAQAEGWQDARRADALRAFATRVTLREGERKFLDLRVQGAVRR